MIEVYGNLWDYAADAVCITTNGFVKNNGEAVMGAGCAKEAAKLFPKLPLYLGQKMARGGGNHVGFTDGEQLRRMAASPVDGVPFSLVFFPVKHHWRQQADLDLIKRSTTELVELTDRVGWKSVVLPRPGCGNGRLRWEYVKPVLEDILDDRFHVITYAASS